jgi:hypothetical protein
MQRRSRKANCNINVLTFFVRGTIAHQFRSDYESLYYFITISLHLSLSSKSIGSIHFLKQNTRMPNKPLHSSSSPRQAISTLKSLICAASAKLYGTRVNEEDMHYLFMRGQRIDENSQTKTIGSILLESSNQFLDPKLEIPTLQVYGPGFMPLQILEEWEISLVALVSENNEALSQVGFPILVVLSLFYISIRACSYSVLMRKLFLLLCYSSSSVVLYGSFHFIYFLLCSLSFSFAERSLYNYFRFAFSSHGSHVCFASALCSFCVHFVCFVVDSRPLCGRFAVALRSLCVRFVLALCSLCFRFAFASRPVCDLFAFALCLYCSVLLLVCFVSLRFSFASLRFSFASALSPL